LFGGPAHEDGHDERDSGGMMKSQRQSPLATTSPPTENRVQDGGESFELPTWPSWIMNPKMPAKVPRSVAETRRH
jgi:hypothetical protein